MGSQITMRQLEIIEEHNSSKSDSTLDGLKKTLTEELIIGICCPIGSKKDEVIESIKRELSKYNYNTNIIKISEFISKYSPEKRELKKGESDEYLEFISKIEKGNQLRELHKNNALMADIAIREIALHRGIKAGVDMNNPQTGSENVDMIKSVRTCHIIDSIKCVQELDTLREVYRDIFYLFNIFSPEDERIDHLTKSKNLKLSDAKNIIETDNHQDSKFGQKTRKVFVNGDFFLRVSEENLEELDSKIERYFNLIFENKIITPHPNEIAMYAAKSVAGNSACLSRQVGAAITNMKGEIISRGWNDVPKFGGNLYKEGSINDKRCFNEGYCSNTREQNEIIDGLYEKIIENPEAKKILNDDTKKEILKILKQSPINSLIEFSRAVHAEMHAIIMGSQLSGSEMVEGKLFCTTYPCHNCARHIIVAGIKEIYYIEPYSKSKGVKLHWDSLTEKEKENDRVKILIYDGVAPRRFLEFFSMRAKRKNEDGILIEKEAVNLKPKNQLTLEALNTLETQAIRILKEAGLDPK